MSVKLVWITPDAEKLIAYMARVSNPQNQNNEKIAGLLKYCLDHHHYSIFDMASFAVEITTSAAIAKQLLRHWSAKFQEFSQRYAEVESIEDVHPRRQDYKNRQNSIDDLSDEDKRWFQEGFTKIKETCLSFYKECLNRGIAKESARFALPMAATSRIYMCNSIRNWIFYINLRIGNGTQLEHMEIANEIKQIFIKELPIISEALGWTHNVA